jgi:hypothetical protein
MLRKVACASVFLVVGFGLAMADEFRATITKVDGDKVTFKKGKKGEEGEAMTLPVTAKGKYNLDAKKREPGEPLEGGLKNKIFAKIKDKGIRATITTDPDKKTITAILVGGGKNQNKDEK